MSTQVPRLITLWMAVLVDVGSLVLVVLNGVRPLSAFPAPPKEDEDSPE